MSYVAYAETVDEAPVTARMVERLAFEDVVEQIETGMRQGGVAVAAAIAQVRRLWFALLPDLASDANEFPDELRASLISIGIWALRACENVTGESDPRLPELREIHRVIGAGLR